MVSSTTVLHSLSYLLKSIILLYIKFILAAASSCLDLTVETDQAKCLAKEVAVKNSEIIKLSETATSRPTRECIVYWLQGELTKSLIAVSNSI